MKPSQIVESALARAQGKRVTAGSKTLPMPKEVQQALTLLRKAGVDGSNGELDDVLNVVAAQALGVDITSPSAFAAFKRDHEVEARGNSYSVSGNNV